MKQEKIRIQDLQMMKVRGEKLTALTAYDYTSAKILDAVGIPMLLVGDTLGVVVLGHDTTVPVTMDDMLHHIRAVMRGASRSFVVGDLPFMSYRVSTEEALRNTGRLIQDGGCDAVKLEGGSEVVPVVKSIVGSGIPVVGHLGYTPQSVHRFGKKRVIGKDAREARQLIIDAKALEDAGAFAIVLECLPSELAARITRELSIITIGIGSGVGCDGQIQVLHDILGLYTDFLPRHAKRYANLAGEIASAVRLYDEEVRAGAFPGSSQTVFFPVADDSRPTATT